MTKLALTSFIFLVAVIFTVVLSSSITVNAAETTYPHQRLANPDCPQYLSGSVHPVAGLGHKAMNYYTMLSAAEYLGLRYLHTPFPASSTHKNYDNSLADWLGFAEGEYLIGDPTFSGLTHVTLPSWSGKYMTRREEVFEVHRAFIDQFYRDTCNIVFHLPLDRDDHFAPVPIYHVKKTAEDKYRRARAREPYPLDYNQTAINLAIYLRNGDFEPTSEPWLLHAAIAVKEVLDELGSAPVHTHIFSFLPPSPMMTVLTPLLGKDVFFHTNTPVRHTLHHLINADVVVRSASSFSEVAVMAADTNRTLFIHPPVVEHLLTWDTCYPGGICGLSGRGNSHPHSLEDRRVIHTVLKQKYVKN